MRQIFLHDHPGFKDLLQVVAGELGIAPLLVEKDYWIMHCLYGLKNNGFQYYLKGGTSLSKGYKIIHRFSEDIDVLIEPPSGFCVAVERNQNRSQHRQSRKGYYDWLAKNIDICGIHQVMRDPVFDDEKYRSGGIRLVYPTSLLMPEDIKQGILLEVGFDAVAPNAPVTISSWAYDLGAKKVEVKDNRATDVLCYHPGYTLVEKLQTVSTKFRKQQARGMFSENFMRHYYDIYHLLNNAQVQCFVGTPAYQKHKKARFRAADNQNISSNEAFLMHNPNTLEQYKKQYAQSQSLYYRDKPPFEAILGRINAWSTKL